MKILFFSQYFFPEEFRANDIVRGLCENGHEVTVVTGLPNYPGGEFFIGYHFFSGPYNETWEGIKIIRMPLFRRGEASRVGLALNYLSFAFFSSILAPFRLRGDYDIVLCWMVSPVTQVIPAIVAKKLNAAPLVLWVMDLWPDSLSASGQIRNRFIVRMARSVTRWVYRNCDRILGQSRSFASHIAGVAGVPAENVGYMPQWEPDIAEKDVAIPSLPAGFRVMFTGNVGNAQDFGTVIAAASILRERQDIHWIIIGEGLALADARRQVRSLGLETNFHFLGRFPIEAMPAFYQKADVLLATLRPADIFARTIPTKILSYLASEVPLITAIDGEVTRLVNESGAGMAVPSGQASLLAEAVKKMADIPKAKRREMGSRGRRYFLENFDRSRLLARLSSLLQEEVDKHVRR
jgi:colanic acid biosynthesis glycosyl transferase WcaI